MTTYRYTDSTAAVVHIIDPDGVSRSSMLASALPEGVEILPYVAPPPAVPHSVTRAQAIAALIITGKRALVQQVIDSIPDPVQRELAQNDWDNRLNFEIDNPRLVGIAAALGIDLNEMFILAGQQ
mgnify:CR=1 FL=1